MDRAERVHTVDRVHFPAKDHVPLYWQKQPGSGYNAKGDIHSNHWRDRRGKIEGGQRQTSSAGSAGNSMNSLTEKRFHAVDPSTINSLPVQKKVRIEYHPV